MSPRPLQFEFAAEEAESRRGGGPTGRTVAETDRRRRVPSGLLAGPGSIGTSLSALQAGHCLSLLNPAMSKEAKVTEKRTALSTGRNLATCQWVT